MIEVLGSVNSNHNHNDTKISMARAIVGNRATSGTDVDQLLRPTTDRTIRGDRSYDQS